MKAPTPSALLLACAPIPLVRIGLIGVGQRGLKTLERYAFIKGAEIRAIADLNPYHLQQAAAVLKESHRPQAVLYQEEDGWKNICQRKDIDLVYVCTEWSTHTPMAVYAMEQGKHVAVEVPAARTVAECWQLVSTSEKTQRHCFMTENCCYDLFALASLEMAHQNRFGHITHVEGAYIHNLQQRWQEAHSDNTKQDSWMELCCARHGGNPYPTHGMGPIGWLLDLHRGDRMDYLVSMTNTGHGTECLSGRVNTTLIRTLQGRSILLQLDLTTPRPYSRLQTVCGTSGYAQKYPLPSLQFDHSTLLTGDDALRSASAFETSDAALRWHEGHAMGVKNEMNYAMDSRLIHCLRNGLPLDIDVYDAAEWSCLSELSELSARQGSRPVSIPDFTQGHWEEIQGFRFY